MEQSSDTSARPTVLVVDDDALVRRGIARSIASSGYRTLEAASGAEALVLLDTAVDVVVSDLMMPGCDGLDLLRQIRARDESLPVIFLTAHPSVDTAALALEHGAFRYLLKPVPTQDLQNAVGAAVRARLMTRARSLVDDGRAALEARLKSAIDTLRLVYQPIVSVETRTAVGYEVLMRSSEPTLPHPGAVLDAAEKLGSLHLLGRHIRALTAEAMDSAPGGAQFFVNLHPADLADAELFDIKAPLARHAHRIILELTERASLETIPDVRERIAALRRMRFRIAIDDLGAGYAGLSYFADVAPDMVKIDMSLVRNIHTDPVKQRVVLALVTLASSLDIEVVAEGVETVDERDALISAGCHFVQGYLLARPGAPYPEVTWA